MREELSKHVGDPESVRQLYSNRFSRCFYPMSALISLSHDVYLYAFKVFLTCEAESGFMGSK